MIDRMGPLAGLRVLEFEAIGLEAIGPAPFAGMMRRALRATALRVLHRADSEITCGEDVAATASRQRVGGLSALLKAAVRGGQLVAGCGRAGFERRMPHPVRST